jgi:hypothetical protein
MKRKKRNAEVFLRNERNMERDKRKGIDYYAAGLNDQSSTHNHVNNRLVVQRLKHVTKSMHWYVTSSGVFFHYPGLGPHLPF